MMHASMLVQEELRTFDELISCFDSLTEAQVSVVGVTNSLGKCRLGVLSESESELSRPIKSGLCRRQRTVRYP
jgi:hypothetical protein